MNNFFNSNDDEGEFRDMPDEVSGEVSYVPNIPNPPRPKQAVKPPVVQAPVIEEIYEEVEEGQVPEEDDYTAYLNDARLRLEQGRLYEMIINHDIFSGLDSDPKAIKTVQSQIRRFAREQMEIMLGMRQEAQKTQTLSVENFPFNDLEVITLKTIAATFSKGATEDPRAQQYSGPPPVRKTGLNSISTKQAVKSQPVKPQPIAQKPQPKPLAKTSVPMPRIKVDQNLEMSLRQEGVESHLIEEAKRQLENDTYKPINKPLNELSEDEILQRNREAALRNRQAAKNPNAAPMPSDDQQMMFHSSRIMDSNANPRMQQLMGMLTKG